MASTGEFPAAPQPYPARPRWSGDFHRLEASLFSSAETATGRANDFAEAYVPGQLRRRHFQAPLADHYVLMQLPDMPSVRYDLSMLGDEPG